MPLNPHLVAWIINGLWVIFALYWLLNAFGNKKSVYRQGRFARLIYLALLAGFIYAILHVQQLQLRLLPYTLATQIVGITLCAVGIGFAIWARRVLGGNWSGVVTLKEDHVLVRRGPYRIVRHPIYTGAILGAIGSFIALLPTLQGVVCVVFLTIMLRVKSLFEESLLVRQFPEDYLQYKREVRALIPFLY
jgi:protein-S-isoprenylcysteine O-methyltransferase Ste14